MTWARTRISLGAPHWRNVSCCPGSREPVLGLIVAGRGFVIFTGDIAKVGGAGNTEDLLDDVGNSPEHWTQDDGRHGTRGNAPQSARSNHDKPLSTVTLGFAA